MPIACVDGDGAPWQATQVVSGGHMSTQDMQPCTVLLDRRGKGTGENEWISNPACKSLFVPNHRNHVAESIICLRCSVQSAKAQSVTSDERSRVAARENSRTEACVRIHRFFNLLTMLHCGGSGLWRQFDNNFRQQGGSHAEHPVVWSAPLLETPGPKRGNHRPGVVSGSKSS